jgi:hypothetical protein
MRPVVRQQCFICFMMVIVTLGGVVLARAEPSSACRTLAKQFAETPEKVSDDSLFRLQTCIHGELRNRGADELSARQPPLRKPPSVPGFAPPSGVQ